MVKPHHQLPALLIALWLWSLGGCCATARQALALKEQSELQRCTELSVTADEEEACGLRVIEKYDALNLALDGESNR